MRKTLKLLIALCLITISQSCESKGKEIHDWAEMNDISYEEAEDYYDAMNESVQ